MALPFRYNRKRRHLPKGYHALTGDAVYCPFCLVKNPKIPFDKEISTLEAIQSNFKCAICGELLVAEKSLYRQNVHEL